MADLVVHRVRGPSGKIHRFEAPRDVDVKELEAEARKIENENLEKMMSRDKFTASDIPVLATQIPGIRDIELGNIPDFLKGAVTQADIAKAGIGRAGVNTFRGIQDLARDVAPGDSPGSRALDADIAESRTIDNPLLSHFAGQVGNIIGSGAFSSPLGMGNIAKTLLGTMAASSGAAALEPTVGDESRAENMAIGAATGGAANVGLRGVGAALHPVADKARGLLADEGVLMTPGQIMGGAVKNTEDKLTSIPFVGNMIDRARDVSTETFNLAALNRALAPIGEKATVPGRDGIKEAIRKLGDAYDKVLPNISIDLADDSFSSAMQRLNFMVREQGREDVEKAASKVAQAIRENSTPQGKMSGVSFKQLETDIRKIAESNQNAVKPVRDFLREVRSQLKQVRNKQNPRYAPDLEKIDEGFSNLARIKEAAKAIGRADELITPAQLLRGVKNQDKSFQKGAFARGEATMQDLAQAGKEVLPSTISDSGTAGRGLLPALGAAFAAGQVGPGAMAALASGGGAYTQPVQGLMRKALTAKRPPGLLDTRNILRTLTPYIGAGATKGILEERRR